MTGETGGPVGDDDRPWTELTTDEQDRMIEQAWAPLEDAEDVPVTRVGADVWAPTEGDDDPDDDYVEGVDAERGDETP